MHQHAGNSNLRSKVVLFQQFVRATSIGSLPRKNLGKSAEPSERPPQSPLRGKFPRRASRRDVPSEDFRICGEWGAFDDRSRCGFRVAAQSMHETLVAAGGAHHEAPKDLADQAAEISPRANQTSWDTKHRLWPQRRVLLQRQNPNGRLGDGRQA